MTDSQKYRMRLVRAHLDYITSTINDIDTMLDSLIAPYENAVQLLCTIPGDGNNGSFFTTALHNTFIFLFIVRRLVGFHGCMSDLHQCRFEVDTGTCYPDRFLLTSRFIVAGSQSCPTTEAFGIRKRSHIGTSPGVDRNSAITVISEIGTDMTPFSNSKRLCCWAGLTPDNNESAGKKKSVRITRAGVYLKPALVHSNWTAFSYGAIKELSIVSISFIVDVI